MEKRIEQFYNVLGEKKITTVFQPILDLWQKEVLGYEALSRVTDENMNISIKDMFQTAEAVGELWKLEKLCRKKAIENAASLPEGKKLFLNVDANVILDQNFKSGFTKKNLEKHNIKPENIVFEITERSDVNNQKILKRVVKHYMEQGFEIAIDDVGSGYSGLNRINSLEPQFLKIDYELVHNISESKSQRALVALIVKYCSEMNIAAIAEGIETTEELKCLLKLGVRYGQGFLFAKPQSGFYEQISEEPWIEILNEYQPQECGKNQIGKLSKMGTVLSTECLSFDAYSTFAKNKKLKQAIVVDQKNKFCGVLKRDYFDKNWWLSIEEKRVGIASYVEQEHVLIADEKDDIRKVLKKALKRKDNWDDPIVVQKKGRYYGIVEMRELLLDIMEQYVPEDTENKGNENE